MVKLNCCHPISSSFVPAYFHWGYTAAIATFQFENTYFTEDEEPLMVGHPLYPLISFTISAVTTSAIFDIAASLKEMYKPELGRFCAQHKPHNKANQANQAPTMIYGGETKWKKKR
jgi:uncharacterized membrane protein